MVAQLIDDTRVQTAWFGGTAKTHRFGMTYVLSEQCLNKTVLVTCLDPTGIFVASYFK